jgi:hypothetical protein
MDPHWTQEEIDALADGSVKDWIEANKLDIYWNYLIKTLAQNPGGDGAVGPMGPEGPEGPAGPQGPAGDDGATGPQGLPGADGAAGPQGIQGNTGPMGPQGIQGPEGPEGPAGSAGTISSVPIFQGNADPGQNIHGTDGTVSDIAYVGTFNGAYPRVTGAAITVVEDSELNLHATVGIFNSGTSKTAIYVLRVQHLSSSDAVEREYYSNVIDAKAKYGVLSAGLRIFISAGDKIKVQVVVLDTTTNTGTVVADPSLSQIFIDRITIT